MNYEEKYKEALERAKDMLSYKEVRKEDMEYLFPELQEGNDERIRKKLICFVENWKKEYGPNSPLYEYAVCTSDRDECDKILAWLEKQKPIDEEELKKGALKYVARQFMNWLDASTPEDKMCLSNMECEDIEDAFLKDDWARIVHYIKKKLEKQGEKLDPDKVIEWLDEHVPTKFEDMQNYVNQFKKDFVQ